MQISQSIIDAHFANALKVNKKMDPETGALLFNLVNATAEDIEKQITAVEIRQRKREKAYRKNPIPGDKKRILRARKADSKAIKQLRKAQKNAYEYANRYAQYANGNTLTG